jgi:hypothetical protein
MGRSSGIVVQPSYDFFCVSRRLANRFDSVEKFIELTGKFSRRLHRDDLLDKQLKRVFDQIELTARDLKVVSDFIEFRKALVRDVDVFLRNLGFLIVHRPSFRDQSVPLSVTIQLIGVDLLQIALVPLACHGHIEKCRNQAVGLS